MLSVRARICRWVWSRLTARVGAHGTPQEMQAPLAHQLDRPILPRGVTLQKTTVAGVRAEWLVPAAATPGAVLLYVHGGAWTMGWYEPHRWLVSHLARATARRALALDYRLAPAYPFPAALDDCLAAYRWLLANGTHPEKIIIAGDSAGGNLTLATMVALRDGGEPLPAAGVCLSPVTDLAGSGRPQESIHDAGLPVGWAQQQTRFYLGDADPHLPLVSPYHADLRGLPPLLVQVGADEYLLHDAQRFVPRARAAGVDVTLQVWPGMWHVWQILVGFMPEANQAVAAIAAFCRQHQPQARATPGSQN
jgi:monoterpene epsilon-lactone hydrolase